MDILNKGNEMHDFVKQIFPYSRSITGEGVRKTLHDIKNILKDYDTSIEFNINEVASGTNVFDWTVPKEWKIKDAYIEDEHHNKIVDFKNNNLSIVGYSTPVDKWVDLEELKGYIYTQTDQPDVIPYVTSYYKERFGFCMSQKQKDSLENGEYHMYIDSEHFDGVLNYGEVVLKGKSEKEIFFSTYVCHPSMANNECSGIALATQLIKYVSDISERKYTYRFIFIPETIGSITYMATNNNLEKMKNNIVAGFNLSCVGDDRNYSIVETRNANTIADKALNNILAFNGDYAKYPFIKAGSDERQYNAPFIELPVVGFCRSKYGEYKEYHTSADNYIDVVTPSGLQGSYNIMCQTINGFEYNEYYKVKVLGEPQLGKRGLYPTISQKGSYNEVTSMVNFIKYCDGKNDLFDISNKINVPVSILIPIIDKLLEHDLIGK